MKYVRAFISDLDGTLLDVRERTAHAHSIALQQAGYQIELERLRALNRYSLDSRELLLQLNIDLTPHEFHKYIRTLQHAFYSGWYYSQVIHGAVNALKEVRKKTKAMQLITSRNVAQITKLEVRKFELDRYFDQIITRSDLAQADGVDFVPMNPFVTHRRRLIQLALQNVDSNGDVWVIGDTAGELEAARTLGFITVGVLTGVAIRDDLEPFAHYILDSIAEIDKLI